MYNRACSESAALIDRIPTVQYRYLPTTTRPIPYGRYGRYLPHNCVVLLVRLVGVKTGFLVFIGVVEEAGDSNTRNEGGKADFRRLAKTINRII